MWFAEALALLGLAGILVPVVLHFLGRPKPVEEVFPAVQFLLRKRVAAARLYTLREVLILMLRMLLVAVGVFVLAGPEVSLRLPTCTVKGEIDRDLVILLDNSPLSGYLPPEVPGRKVTVLDLYRDLALEAVSRVREGRAVSLVPVDVRACATLVESPYLRQVEGALRAARPGDGARYSDAFRVAYVTALQRSPAALLALTLAKLPDEWDRKRVRVVQARPLSGMAPVRNRGLERLSPVCAGSPFARNEFFCTVGNTGPEARVRVLLEGEGGRLLDRAVVDVPERGTAEAAVGFVPKGAGEERLTVRLEPGDRLGYDDAGRVVFESPGWPDLRRLGAGGAERLDALLEAYRSFASGYGKGGETCLVMVLGSGDEAEYVERELSEAAEEVVKGAGMVVFLEGFPEGFRDGRGLLPVLDRGPGESEKEKGKGKGVWFGREWEERLSAAGVTATASGGLKKALSEAEAVPAAVRAGAAVLAGKGDVPLGVWKPFGKGRVVLWNAGRVERLLARAPGGIVPLFCESVFLAAGWKAETRRGEVGEECRVPVGFRVGKTRVMLKAPGEDEFRRLYVAREGTEYPGFVPGRAGFWVMRVEDPSGEPSYYTIGVDAPKAPDLAPLEETDSPEEALDELGQADRSKLSAPLAAVFLLLVVLEAAAGNLLYRRVPGRRRSGGGGRRGDVR